MPSALNRNQWSDAVRQHRSMRIAATPKPTSLEKRNWAERVPRQSTFTWRQRVELSRTRGTGGSRHRALVFTGTGKKSFRRKTGGMLKSNSQKGRDLTEAQRQSLPKTGHLVSKKGINATGWAYDHRAYLAKRRQAATKNITKSTEKKKGINAEKWHYDHQKAMASAKKKAGRMVKPTTHARTDRIKRVGKQATNQPSQPKTPQQPTATKKPQPVKAAAPRRVK